MHLLEQGHTFAWETTLAKSKHYFLAPSGHQIQVCVVCLEVQPPSPLSVARCYYLLTFLHGSRRQVLEDGMSERLPLTAPYKGLPLKIALVNSGTS